MKRAKPEHAHIIAEGDGTRLIVREDGTPCVAVELKDGQPIPPCAGQVANVKGRKGSPCLDLTVTYDQRDQKGPSKANSRAFRAGYDRIRWN